MTRDERRVLRAEIDRAARDRAERTAATERALEKKRRHPLVDNPGVVAAVPFGDPAAVRARIDLADSTFRRIRGACCGFSTINLDEHAARVANALSSRRERAALTELVSAYQAKEGGK